MSLKGWRVVGVVLMGLGVSGVSGRALAGQVVGESGRQKVAAQIIEPDQEDEFIKGAFPEKTPGLVLPVLTRGTDPKYTPETLRAKVEGTVKIQAVVGTDGRVEKARVKAPVDPALDAQALRALDEWKFEPGRLDGKPVRVLIEVQMAFRVH